MALKTTGGDGGPAKGRGAPSNPEGRYERWHREPTDDAARAGDDPHPAPRTIVIREHARSIIARNDSPDVPFDRSINPYQGCEHGCTYCYARPAHAYLGLSPGLDFETRIFAKHDAARLLRAELGARGYVCGPIAIGGNTDPYQPAERDLRITRSVIEVLVACAHPFSVITKNALVERDADLLAPMAIRGMARAHVSVTSLDGRLSGSLEPRASAPHRRLETIRRLADAGVPVGVMIAPVIPFVTDRYLEEILERAREAGASSAGYIMLRLPHEVAPLFREWLAVHYPLKAAHVMSLMQGMRGGRDYDARWSARQVGMGPLAEIIARRFRVATRRLGLDTERPPLDTRRFRPPREGPQRDLFDPA
jgi:DNA repair photolyase